MLSDHYYSSLNPEESKTKWRDNSYKANANTDNPCRKSASSNPSFFILFIMCPLCFFIIYIVYQKVRDIVKLYPIRIMYALVSINPHIPNHIILSSFIVSPLILNIVLLHSFLLQRDNLSL